MTREEQWLLSEKYNGEKTEGFFADCKRLADGEPLAYLIGSIPFLNCTIHLDSHSLIPRPETEYWVEKAISFIQNSQHPNNGRQTSVIRVLDLCAGSGCIGVAVARAIPEASVDFAEIDEEHIPTILKNLEINLHSINTTDSKPFNRLKGLEVIQSDLFENVLKKYNYILTNPPYIDPTLDRAEDSVKNNEPYLALYGGVGGMECIREIIEQTSDYLTDDGVLYIEHEPEQSGAITELAKLHGFTTTTCLDQYNIQRYSILTSQKGGNVAQ